MSKKSLLIITAIATALLLFFTFFPFGEKSNSENFFKADPAFSEYISAHTAGYISNASAIRIMLVKEISSPVEVGKTIEGLFDFSPAINGTATWLDNRTIEFRPEVPLPSDQLFEAHFHLGKLVAVPAGFDDFEFGFHTIPQSFEVYIDGVTTTDRETLRWQNLSGVLSTADAIDDELTPELLSATQNGKKLKIHWEHNGLTHRFTVDSIARTEQENKMTLEWDGEKIGVKKKDSKEIIIPALGDFKVMDVKTIQSPEQHVEIQFSDPLMQKQDLAGLITIGTNTGLKYIIEGNDIRVYPPARLSGTQTVKVQLGVKNIAGYNLKTVYTMDVVFEELKPEIRLIGKGTILPNSEGLVFPFEAVNLRAVDVKIIKIFETNVLQFLQVNNLEGERELKRVARTVLKKTIQLNPKSAADLGRWSNYSFDLAELIKTEPGAIYKVSLSFKKQHSAYTCEGETAEEKELQKTAEVESDLEEDDDWSEYNNHYYYEDYEYYGEDYYDEDGYNDRGDPCKDAYYRNTNVSKNILASDLGIIAKQGTNGTMNFIISDLKTTKPLSGASIEVYNYQLQVIGSSKTDANGMTKIDINKKPFVVVAKNGDQTGYLKLDDGYSLSLSAFDVSGEAVQKGIKGFIYGERGVWRPGDTLFLSFMLEDKENKIPANHPVSFELINPRGQVVKKMVKSNPVKGLYNFTTSTDIDAPTGNWSARVKVGGAVFTKTLKVETIMPNRLKIKLDFENKLLVAGDDFKGKLEVKWLHGAAGRNLNTVVEAVLTPAPTTFKKFEGYHFEDPSRRYSSESVVVSEVTTDNEGKATILPDFSIQSAAPGMLRAYFTVRAFEQGGAFSIDRFNTLYSPYSYYVGMKAPENNPNTGMLETDTNNIIKIATVKADGTPISISDLKVEIYRVKWRWWWDRYDNDLANYSGSEYHEPYSSQTVSTVNGKGQFVFRVNRPDWGRFFVRVFDQDGGHSTGQTLYIDWPSGAGSAPKGSEGATFLSFKADKAKYNVGETVKLTIPSSGEGRALISVESGAKVIHSDWVETKKGQTTYNFAVTEEMAPNIYVNITLLQPHAQTKNDLPIRLYGVVPLNVENPNTHLTPIIKTAAVWKPEQKASITVSEEKGREMVYTLAVVDEGLLDITKFNTPDPWNHFYAREALGVRTWDMYDMVIGAYGGQLERILAIGGDGEVDSKGAKRANRFKPMVKFFGPFHLKAGEKRTQEFIVPQYVGSVRVMAIAGYDAAYGNSEKTVAVRNPLMLLGTLPRVVGPGETVDLPVSVFAMEKHVKNVTVEVIPNNLFSLEDGNKKTLSFKEVGDEVLTFKLKVKSALGVGKVKILATSGSEKATYEIELDVRNPNPKVTDIMEAVIEAGKTWNPDFKPVGMMGTNVGTLELSTLPPINLDKRLRYLLGYPHGCVEQTTSSVFPQLFLTNVLELDANTKVRIDNNVRSGILRLRSFQTTSGGLSYWPGAGYYEADPWGTNYAGHFLLEAEAKGYTLPAGMIDNWKRYQKQKAQEWYAPVGERYYYSDDLIQAYRLYTLALAKAPELGAMNRLKEYKNISVAAKWRLAAAYVLAGQTEVAKKLIQNLAIDVKPYSEMSYSYGSGDRDQAMILETLSLLNDKTQGYPVLKKISAELSQDQWMSTQTTAYCLIAVSKFIKASGFSSATMCTYKINDGNEVNVNSKVPVIQSDMKIQGIKPGKVLVKNNGTGVLFARIVLEGIPETGDQTSAENNLKMDIIYTKMDGSPIDPVKLEQGTDFIAQVTITHPGVKEDYREMALSQIFASGWEIHNTRMDEIQSPEAKSDYPTYQDIRDDRVYTYFDIYRAKTKKFKIILNASYVGRYYLPTIYCEAMYDNTINARKPGKWVEVVKPGENL